MAAAAVEDIQIVLPKEVNRSTRKKRKIDD